MKGLWPILEAVLQMFSKKETNVTELYPKVSEERDIQWKKSPNYSVKRGRAIDAIILHHTASFNFEGDVRWMCDERAKVSAHYCIGLEGEIVQMVRDDHVAWHAGKSSLDGRPYVNNFSIGIELTGDTGQKPLTDKQYEALIWLVQKLMEKHNIPAEKVVDHRYISPGRKVDLDPTNFDWVQFYSDVGAVH